MVKFNQSGNHCPDFRRYNNGDSVLHYMYVMYEDNQMLMKLTDKEIDGGVGTESSIGSAASPTGALGRPAVAARTNTLSKRLSRERNEALSSMAESSAMMADSSRRRAAAKTVEVLSASLSAARKAHSSNVVIQAMEEQLLKCINECSAGPPRKHVRDDAAAEGVGGMGGARRRVCMTQGVILLAGKAPCEGVVVLRATTSTSARQAGVALGRGVDMVTITTRWELPLMMRRTLCWAGVFVEMLRVLAGAQGMLLIRASWMTGSFYLALGGGSVRGPAA